MLLLVQAKLAIIQLKYTLVIINKKPPLPAWFLGPKAEHSKIWSDLINYIFEDYIHWRRNYFPEDQVVVDRVKRREHEFWFDILSSEVDQLLSQLKAHYPFYSPRYLAHMLSEQSMPSVIGYFAGMLYNPNNVTSEAAPITVELELEAGKMISSMLGYNPAYSWAHLTSGGTLANLEALWISRQSLTIPLIIKNICSQLNIPFRIRLPNHTKKDIRNITDLNLMHLDPDVALGMPRKLARYLIRDLGHPEEMVEYINQHIKNSDYNINRVGVHELYHKLGVDPIIVVSEAAHYSIKKCANILGLGEKNVRYVPVDSEFRMDCGKLKEIIFNLSDHEVIIAIIGIAGTTEEGAIDPIHQISRIREDFKLEKNRSFWFHIDAAWGGYIRSILKGLDLDLDYSKYEMKEIYEKYQTLKDISEVIEFGEKKYKIDWKNPQLFYSILSMKEANSITVDPHKMGYILYPAGVICFKNGLVTELIEQKAPYISEDKGAGIKHIKLPPKITSVGPYIIEGSKPGAAAAATWLAHKTIPLTSEGHGQIIRTTLLNTQKLFFYLSQHNKNYQNLENDTNSQGSPNGFTFEPLFQPDSNVVCFIAIPMIWENGKLEKRSTSLKKLNQYNKAIFSKLSLKSEGEKHMMPYGQDFFVSKTVFENDQYNYLSIFDLLQRFDIKKDEYESEGLFVLRSTVMNPWYYLSEQSGVDYLKKFIRYLHKVTRLVADRLV